MYEIYYAYSALECTKFTIPECTKFAIPPSYLPAVERLWHIYDSHGQVLTFTFR